MADRKAKTYIYLNERQRRLVAALIGNTKTKTGLTVQAALDTGKYPIGIQVSDEDLAQVRMEKAEFHGEWNYCISPRPK